MVKAQKALMDHLGIRNVLSVVGGSIGGMQVLEWCVRYPDTVISAIPLATTTRRHGHIGHPAGNYDKTFGTCYRL